MDKFRFQPLESNPDSINEYLFKLGLDPEYGVSDILSFDEENLGFVLRPVHAVFFLFPIKGENIDQDLSCLDETAEERERKDAELSKDLYLIKQTVSNACGTIALIHAIANLRNQLKFTENSIIKQFIDSSLDQSPEERGELLENNKEFGQAHEECAESGETEMEMQTDTHFVVLIEHKGYLWKCDGSQTKRCTRVNITTKDTLLESAAEYVIKFMAKNPNLKFSALSFNEF